MDNAAPQLPKQLCRQSRIPVKKAIALGHDPENQKYVYHRRDFMPNCALKLVGARTVPKLRPEVPYMGHMWESS